MLNMHLCKWYIGLSARHMPSAWMFTNISKTHARRMLPTLSACCQSTLNLYIWGKNLSSKFKYNICLINKAQCQIFISFNRWFCKTESKFDLFFQNNDTWNLDPCRSCRCHEGEIRCAQAKCPTTKCRPNETLVKPAGQCCARCEESEFSTDLSFSKLFRSFSYENILILILNLCVLD